MHTDRIAVRRSTAAWLAVAGRPVRGVFATHLHLDHVLGAIYVAFGVGWDDLDAGPGLTDEAIDLGRTRGRAETGCRRTCIYGGT
jgi:glyoxylase-like metal-dependent hydrolase (beta-lactamase superfamily II)